MNNCNALSYNENASAALPLLLTLGDSNGLGPELFCRFFGQEWGGNGAVSSGALSASSCNSSSASPVEFPFSPAPFYSAVSSSSAPVFSSTSPLALAPAPALHFPMPLIAIGAEAALLHHAAALHIAPFWKRLPAFGTADYDRALASAQGGDIFLLEPQGCESLALHIGTAHPDGGAAAGLTLNLACDILCAQKAQGVVTLPLHKAMLHAAGFHVPGHTEFFARRAGLRDEDVCMHLGGERLRVSLATTHPALKDVPALITRERILHCLRLTAQYVAALGVTAPIAVCGLNPHAGESGDIGREEIDIINPAIAEARAEGINAEGTFPADTVFFRAAQGEFSAVLAMYHDQGLAPLKLLHFSTAVNVTLGLPFVRTSVDHGTGFDITGKGIAHTGSFAEALRLALLLCRAKG